MPCCSPVRDQVLHSYGICRACQREIIFILSVSAVLIIAYLPALSTPQASKWISYGTSNGQLIVLNWTCEQVWDN